MLNSLKISMPRTQYRNRMYVRGYGITNEQTDVFSFDGYDTTFVCAFEINDMRAIYVNGVAQSFETDNALAISEFMWKFGEPQVRMNKNKVIQQGDLITIVYIGRYPIVVSAEDITEIRARAVIERNSGVYESIEEVNDIFGYQRLYDYINAKLQIASRIPIEIDYRTLKWGVHPGMVQSITSTGDAYNLSVDAIIEDVTITLMDNLEPAMKVRATAGTTLERWWDWFKSVKMSSNVLAISTGTVIIGVRGYEGITVVDGVYVSEQEANLWDSAIWDLSNWGG